MRCVGVTPLDHVTVESVAAAEGVELDLEGHQMNMYEGDLLYMHGKQRAANVGTNDGVGW